MEDQEKKDNLTHFDKISITKIKILEYFLNFPDKKLQKYLKFDPDLCCVPLKNHNGQILDMKVLKGISKRLIKKNVFVKSLLRDAWVITRLRVYYLFKLASLHMEKVDLEKYLMCVKEAEKEIINRLNTHEDEEAHVFYALLQLEGLKQHVRAHNLDSIVSEYEKIKECVRKIKETDIGYLINLRINAAIGYAAKLTQNDIVLPQRFHQVVQIYKIHYEEKKQAAFIDETDHFIYFFSQLQLCKYMQRAEQINEAIELAQKMRIKMERKKMNMKAKFKDHFIKEFTHFLEACVSFLQNDQSPRIFDRKRNSKQKKEIIIQSLFNFYDDEDELKEEVQDDQIQEINEAELKKQNLKYQQDYKLVGSLSKYLNNLQVKQEDKQKGIFGFTQQNQNQQMVKFQELQEKILSAQKQTEQQQQQINQQHQQEQGQQDVQIQEMNFEEQEQKYKISLPSQKSIKDIISTRNIQQSILLKSKTNPLKQEYHEGSEEKSNQNDKKLFTEGDKDDNNIQINNSFLEYFGQDQKYFLKDKQKGYKPSQQAFNYHDNSQQTEKMKALTNKKETNNKQRHPKLNQQRLSLTLNSNQLKNINFDQFNQRQKISSTKSISSVKNELLIQDFVSFSNLNKRKLSSESELFQMCSNRAISQQSAYLIRNDFITSASQNQINLKNSERVQTQESDITIKNHETLQKDNEKGSREYKPMSGEYYGKDEFQILQNKYSVTIEKDTPNGVESQLEFFKNNFYKSSSSNNIKVNINQIQKSSSNNTEQEEQQIQPQQQVNEIIIQNEQNNNEQQNNNRINDKQIHFQFPTQEGNLAAKHKKSKTFQQFDKVTSFLDLYGSETNKNQQTNLNSSKSIKIVQKIHKFNNKSQNQAEFQECQNGNNQNDNQVYQSTLRTYSMRDSNSSRFNNIPKDASQQQYNNFITETSLQNQSQITTQQSQRNQSLKVKIIPSDVDKFHLAPFFSQKNMLKHLNHRKQVPSQQTESFQSPNKSLITQTQINSSTNMNIQSQTKETNQSNIKQFETLNTEKSFLSNANSNYNQNYFQQISSPQNTNVKISFSGNHARKISLLSSNKTLNQPLQLNNKDAVLEENIIESEDDQTKSMSNQLYPQSLMNHQQKQNFKQNGYDNNSTMNMNTIFNKINKRKSHQSTFTTNQSQIQSQNMQPNTQRNSIYDVQEQSLQQDKTHQQYLLDNQETQMNSLSSSRLHLSQINTARAAKLKHDEIQQKKIKEYFEKQNQTFGNDEKYGLLQLYLNKMLYVDPYDYLPKQTPKEVYQFMKNKFNKTEVSQSQSTQQEQIDDIQQTNEQTIEQVNANTNNQQLRGENQDAQQIRNSSINNHSKHSTNHKSLDFIFSQQQKQLQQVQMHKHSQTQTSSLQQPNVPSINIGMLQQHRNSINPQQNSVKNQQNKSFLSQQRNSMAMLNSQNLIGHNRTSSGTTISEPRASQYLKEDVSQLTPQIKINSTLFTSDKKSSDPKHKSNKSNSSLDEMEQEKLRKTLIEQIQIAKEEINKEQKEPYSKQVTLFTLNSQHSQESISSRKDAKSKFAPEKPNKASNFKPKMITKNSFDSDQSSDDLQTSPIARKPMKNHNLLRRSRAFEKFDEDEEEIGSQQYPSTQMHSVTSPNNHELKSLSSLAFLLAGKKNWFKFQNKELTLSQSIARQQHAKDEISQKIYSLSLKYPSFCFSTHRIGRFQNWNVRYVEYYHENRCFQINFSGADNLFYKMFIPARQLKDFNHSQNKFVTIWPIILDYLQEYMEQKKIQLKFSDDTNQSKKINIKDNGISKYFQENKVDSTATQVVNKILTYKKLKQQNDQNQSQESINSESSEEDEEESDKDLDSEEKLKKGKKKNIFKFFLGLARKDSYFPTARDALAVAKIKKIFEILLYRYMYDQLRPTGKKLILKKDASTQKYKTLSKKIQKLENDLEKNTFNQLFKSKSFFLH